MIALRKALYQRLASDPALQGKIGDRVYPVLAPRDAAVPYVTYQATSTELSPDLRRAGLNAAHRQAFAVRCWSTNADEAAEIAGRVLELLDGASAADVLGMVVTDQSDDAQFMAEDSAEILYSVELSVLITRRPS